MLSRPATQLLGLTAAIGCICFARQVVAAPPTKDECVDAFTRAQAARQEGKLLASRQDLLLCASESCPKLVRTDCTKGVDELTPLVPSIIFQIKDGAGHDRSDAAISMDSQALSSLAPGSALELDPGPHTFVFSVPDKKPVTLQLVIHEGERARRETITIGAETLAEATTKPLTAPTQTAASQPTSGLGGQRIGALVAGGVGVIGVGLGSFFGVRAMSQKSEAEKVCPGDCRTSEDAEKWSDAKTSGNVSTAAFIIGGVGLVGGVVLWMTAKPPNAEQAAVNVRLSVGVGSLQLRGAW